MYYKTRSHLSQSDYQFIAHSVGHTDSERNAVMRLSDDPEIVTQLLCREDLFRSMIKEPGLVLSVSSSLYFYCLIYQALNFKHLADTDVADYISGICVEFTMNESLWKYTTDASERMVYFVDLERVMSDYNNVQQYHMHQHIGNVALYLTGFFPDVIYQREKQKGAPALSYYEAKGNSHFEAAANASLQYESDVTPVLFKLSEYFSEIRSAINIYVDAYLKLHNSKNVLERIERQSITLDEESFKQSLDL